MIGIELKFIEHQTVKRSKRIRNIDSGAHIQVECILRIYIHVLVHNVPYYAYVAMQVYVPSQNLFRAIDDPNKNVCGFTKCCGLSIGTVTFCNYIYTVITVT